MQVKVVIIFFLFNIILAIAEEPDFWDSQKKGANCFNNVPAKQWFRNARDLGLQWVRLAYDKWDSGHRDFLIGDASNYDGLVPEDLEKLKKVINWAAEYDIQLVITPLSLPGARWRQNNENRPDLRLWESFTYWEQAIQFWIDLANELKDYENIVAYNIINEPHP